MALRSMTGFGSAEGGAAAGVGLSVEVRSVNHKGLDIKVALPSSLAGLETRVLGLARGRLDRGRVNLKVSVGSDGGRGPRLALDVEAARALGAQLEGLRQSMGIEAPVTLDHILAIPNAVLIDPNTALSNDAQATWPALSPLVDAALDALIQERDREGALLAEDMLGRLATIAACVDRIEVEVPRSRETFFARLRERVAEMVAQLEIEAISEERLAQEVIVYAERSDITEEITRARAHLSALTTLIPGHDPEKDGPVGKKLDFYFQELIRETNTMGSKSQSEIIAGCVVEMRSEIDRLREQVLNVA